MLVYLDARLKEAIQCNKLSRGKSLFMLGDFDQHPLIGGDIIPHLTMIILEKKKCRYDNDER